MAAEMGGSLCCGPGLLSRAAAMTNGFGGRLGSGTQLLRSGRNFDHRNRFWGDFDQCKAELAKSGASLTQFGPWYTPRARSRGVGNFGPSRAHRARISTELGATGWVPLGGQLFHQVLWRDDQGRQMGPMSEGGGARNFAGVGLAELGVGRVASGTM